MKNLVRTLLVVFALLTAFANESRASHISGGDVTWQCLGGDTFLVTYNVFRDCSGINAPTSLNVTFSNNCGATFNTTFNQISSSEVSQLCPGQLLQSTCNGGNLPGMEHYVYQATIVFPAAAAGCGTWTMGWSTCCRNNPTNISNTTASSNFIGTMYRDARACNNSPAFTAQPIPYVCANQVVNYNYGVVESDGDSLVFSFDCGFNTGTNPLQYVAPYSCTSPIPGITIDPATGQITFSIGTIGEFVVVVKVEEYDPVTGQLLSVVYRDIQIIVLTCSNQVPFLAQGIHNFTSSTGGGYVVDSNSVEVCIGDSISFDIMFVDPDAGSSPGDSITLVSNIGNVLDTNSLVTTYQNGDTAIMSVGWIAQPGSNPFLNFIVSAIDDACPVTGLYTVQFDISIIPATYAGPDKSVCQGTQASTIEVDGGNAFTWQVILPGQTVPVPMTPGVDYIDLTANLNGEKISYPNIGMGTPAIGQHQLIVTSNLSSSCNNVDTMVVTVAPDYLLTVPNDTLICSIDSFPLFANMTPTYPATFQWKPAGTLSNDTIANPYAYPVFPTDYSVVVESAGGCKKMDTVSIDLSAPFPAGIEIDPGDTILCLNDATQLTVDLGINQPQQCGPAYGSCLGYNSNVTVGTGSATNTSSGYPAIYGGFVASVRNQILFTAAELNAMGFTGGRINSISFDVGSVGTVSNYSNFQMKMGCSNAADLDSGWETGLIEVLSPSSHTVTTGWNTHTLSTPYFWDGVSNLVLEVCYSNTSGQGGGSSGTRYSFTPFTSVRYLTSTQGFACSSGQAGLAVQQRPNVRFGICQGADPQQFTYSWTPNTNISNVTVPDPIVNPTTGTTYTVIVTDVYGGCADTIEQFINVTTQFDAGFMTNSPYCISSPVDTLQEVIGGGVFSGTGILDPASGAFDPATAGIGSHTITYNLFGNCANDSSITIQVIPLPDASITSTPEICYDTNATFDMTSALPNGVWSGTLIVDSINGTIDPSLGNPGSTADIVYTLTQPCLSADTVQVVIIEPFIPVIDDPLDICESDTVDFQFNLQTGPFTGTGPVVQTWSSPSNGITDQDSGYFSGIISGAGTHDVILEVTDAYGACAGYDTVQIQVLPLPSVEFTNLEAGYCDDITANTKIFANQPFGPGDILGYPVPPTTDTLDAGAGFIPSVVGEGKWVLFFEYTDGNGCYNFTEDTLRILNTPSKPGIVDREYCIGDLMVFEATGDNLDSIYWYESDTLGTPVYQGSPWLYGVAQDPAVNPLKFWLVERNLVCVSEPRAFTPIINPDPDGYFDMTFEDIDGNEQVEYPHDLTDSLNPVYGKSPMGVTFHSRNVLPGDSIYWDFFNNPYSQSDAGQCGWPANTAGANTPTGAYSYWCDGLYKVMQIHTNQYGCIDTAFAWIDVEFTAEVPNVFTPNGDGNNDNFQVLIYGLRDYRAAIYNRWGKLLYEWNDPDGGWDGKINGSDAAEGVYFYVASGKQASGEDFTVQGHLTLVR